MTAFSFEVLVSLKPGLSDPQGKAVEGALPALGWTNVGDVKVGKHIQLTSTPTTAAAARAQVAEMAERLLSNPVIEDYRIVGGAAGVSTARGPRVGVVTFPGSLDDRDALRAVATMGGDRRAGVARRRRPRRRRRRRSCRAASATATTCDAAPSLGSRGSWTRSARSPTRGGPVLGICNGFQILCEAGLLPGALIRNRSLRFVCRRVHLRVETSQSAVTGGLVPGETLEIPIKHGEGQFVARAGRAGPDGGRGPGRVPLLPRPTGVVGRRLQPERRARDNIAGVRNAAGNVVGLMPHPEHAVDPDVGPTGGQPMFASLLAAAHVRGSRPVAAEEARCTGGSA